MNSSTFYLRPYQDRAPKVLRGKKDQVVKKKPIKGLALPPQIDLIRRESYVPNLHNPSTPIRPGAEDFLDLPSLYGVQSTYHDRGHL